MAGKRGKTSIPDSRFIGCCGAYCRTCRSLKLGTCKGCKLGYEDGQRDIARARCKIKVCCYARNGLETCAECPQSDRCEVLRTFHNKKWKEYEGYRQSFEFIRENGYDAFVRAAKGWTRGYGELNPGKKSERRTSRRSRHR